MYYYTSIFTNVKSPEQIYHLIIQSKLSHIKFRSLSATCASTTLLIFLKAYLHAGKKNRFLAKFTATLYVSR